MGGAPSPPPAPDPIVQQKIAQEGAEKAAKIQGEYNLKALQQSQAASMIGQNTPIGSISYKQNGVDQYGNPLYDMNAKLSAEQEALYKQTTATQGTYGQAGGQLAASSMPLYSDAGTMMRNLFTGADSLTSMRVNAANKFQDPFNKQDVSWLDNKLRNQGLMPGDPGYDAQINRLQSQQSLNQQNFISNVLPQSMAEASAIYDKPLQTASALTQMGQPAALTQMNTPQFTSKPSDYTSSYGAGLTAQNQNYQNQIAGYNAQAQAHGNMMNGIFGMAGGAMKLFI